MLPWCNAACGTAVAGEAVGGSWVAARGGCGWVDGGAAGWLAGWTVGWVAGWGAPVAGGWEIVDDGESWRTPE